MCLLLVSFVSVSVSDRSLYREILFLTVAAMGKDHVGEPTSGLPRVLIKVLEMDWGVDG